MALVGLTEAACQTGKHPTTILRARASRRLSSSLNSSGRRVFDTAELDRAYGLKAGDGARPDAGAPELQSSSALLRKVELLHQRVSEQAEAIRDLRARLDAASEDLRREGDERRRVQERLTGLLTHRQAGSVPTVQRMASEPRVTRWRRWFGK